MRQLTRTQYLAEVFAGTADNIAVIAVWSGLAIDASVLVYFGVFLILARPVTVLFVRKPSHAAPSATIDWKLRDATNSYIAMCIAFAIGSVTFLLLNQDAADHLWSLWEKNDPAVVDVLWQEVREYGFLAVLWYKTGWAVIAMIGAATQITQYETGAESVDQYD